MNRSWITIFPSRNKSNRTTERRTTVELKYPVQPRGKNKGLPFNFRKMMVLGLFIKNKLLSSADVSRALGMSRTSASVALLRYWRNDYLSRKPHYTGELGRPPFVYSITAKGGQRYNEYRLRFERGLPLNLHRYRIPKEGKLPRELERLIERG